MKTRVSTKTKTRKCCWQFSTMWVEILCGLVIYKLYRVFVGGDEIPNVDSRDSDASFAVAKRLEKVFGGKAYVGLRIPDAETDTRLSIDVVLVTKKEVVVVVVRNISGSVEVGGDGNWVCTGHRHPHKVDIYPDPIAENNRQMEALRLYFDHRGLTLPKGCMTGKIILPNPNCRVTDYIDSMPEVISFSKWAELKPEFSGFSAWIKDAFRGDKAYGSYQQIHSILSTSPMWDRLELKGDKYILGEFVEFKGKLEDMQALKNIKRSKVSHFIVQKSSMFGTLGRSKIYLLYAHRDYRSEGSSSSEWKEIIVKATVEVMFIPANSEKVQKFKLSHIVSLSLSA